MRLNDLPEAKDGDVWACALAALVAIVGGSIGAVERSPGILLGTAAVVLPSLMFAGVHWRLLAALAMRFPSRRSARYLLKLRRRLALAERIREATTVEELEKLAGVGPASDGALSIVEDV